MTFQPWYKVVELRKEVREGRSFNPDEFAIALEQVAAGTAPPDYRDPAEFFRRTYFTRALKEHASMVLKRLAGETANTAPVLTLITQFGGGKTHTLTALYHMVKAGAGAKGYPGMAELLAEAGLKEIPSGRVAVFVGNAWDPKNDCPNPWTDLAFQIAGKKGVEALGASAATTAPGTEALGRLFAITGEPVLVLFDEVLNFINRHRNMADSFHAFIQNLTVAMTGTKQAAAVISLPRSQVEMTEWDLTWQEKITKVVRRVAKDLIANDETEISEVVRRRLFDGLGPESHRKKVARAFADWCFVQRAQLPPEWTRVDSATTRDKAVDHLQGIFEACFPFHPACLSVFQRKWQTLSQYQQTRGTLAMLAQWISLAYKDAFTHARKEPLITLGSAPLEIGEFRSIVLGQVGEVRLGPAISADLAGDHAHARVLDADTKGPLRDVHRRVGTAVFFESCGGQVDKMAHLPELRFALGEPEMDTTSIDTALSKLEKRAYYLRRVGTDGYRFHYKPTLKKVVNDRRASLDPSSEIKPTMGKLIKEEFERGKTIPTVGFPESGTDVPDSPRLTLVISSPDEEWIGKEAQKENLRTWFDHRGNSPRLYPGALVFCFKKPGRDLRDKVEAWLAWERVQFDVNKGSLGTELDTEDLKNLAADVKSAQADARDEVWASYRYIALSEPSSPGGVTSIDLGAVMAGSGTTLCGRIIAALKQDALLNESIGAGYIDRNWPESFKASGAWPLAGLRKCLVDGTLTRLLEPDTVLKRKIPEFVLKGDFGLAAGDEGDGKYQRFWYKEEVSPDEVMFDYGVFLLRKDTATEYAEQTSGKQGTSVVVPGTPPAKPTPLEGQPAPSYPTTTQPSATAAKSIVTLSGPIPPELWNRLGTSLITKLRGAGDLKAEVSFTVEVDTQRVKQLEEDIRRVLGELGIPDRIHIELSEVKE